MAPSPLVLPPPIRAAVGAAAGVVADREWRVEKNERLAVGEDERTVPLPLPLPLLFILPLPPVPPMSEIEFAKDDSAAHWIAALVTSFVGGRLSGGNEMGIGTAEGEEAALLADVAVLGTLGRRSGEVGNRVLWTR